MCSVRFDFTARMAGFENGTRGEAGTIALSVRSRRTVSRREGESFVTRLRRRITSDRGRQDCSNILSSGPVVFA